MKLEREHKEMLREEYRKLYPTDEKMVEHCVGGVSCVALLRGRMVPFRKPSIKTSFWFGERGYDYDEVSQTCRQLSTDEQYFLNENLGGTDAAWVLRQLMDGCFPFVPCFAADDRNDLARIEWRQWDEVGDDDPDRLTADEVAELKRLMEEEQEKFEKRLRSYLKRYGLSKCSFGTYWADR